MASGVWYRSTATSIVSSNFAIVGFFGFDHLNAHLAQDLRPVAVDIRRGENDPRGFNPCGFGVQTPLALQAIPNGASNARGDFNENMLMVVDDDVELFASDDALLNLNPKGVLQQCCNGLPKHSFIANSPSHPHPIGGFNKFGFKGINTRLHLLETLIHVVAKRFYLLIDLLKALVHLDTQGICSPLHLLKALIDLLKAIAFSNKYSV